jgi:hypothetical protein
MIIMGLLAVAISVAALVITRGLLKQLGGEPDYTASIAGSIANGDLSIRSTPQARQRQPAGGNERNAQQPGDIVARYVPVPKPSAPPRVKSLPVTSTCRRVLKCRHRRWRKPRRPWKS